MIRLLIIAFFNFLISDSFAQLIVLDSIHSFSSELKENSGIIFLNNKLITHTDSGGENALFEIDSLNTSILRKIYLKNANNTDWEDIAQDDDNIYIADFGNNQGNRIDLKIYIVDKVEFQTTVSDSVETQVINFVYEDQIDFTSANQNNNFDAEALIVFEDSLYIFTKNWINEETNIYGLTKTPGTDTARFISSFDIGGLVTGADYDGESKIFLSAYTKLLSPFIFQMDSFINDDFFSGNNSKHELELKASYQIEGICVANNDKVYVSSEEFLIKDAVLHSFIDTAIKTDSLLSIENIKIRRYRLFPNPIKDFLSLEDIVNQALLYNLQGKLVLKSKKNNINLKHLNEGYYFLILKFKDNSQQTIKFKHIK